MYEIIKEIKKSIKVRRIKDLFRIDQEKYTNIFHSNYLIAFVLEFILFGCLSIYLYKSSKYYNKNIENNVISVPRGLKEKYELSIFLTHAVLFRCLTFIYFIFFANRTSYDLISYINFLLHIFPSFMFLMGLYINIGFLIEKFYEISLKRIYILTSLKYILYFSLLLITLLSISVFFCHIYKESYFFTEALMCLNFLIIGFLYLIYGKKISSFVIEANSNRVNNPLAMKNIRNLIRKKIIGISIIICPSYITVGAIKGLVAINFFGTWYPNFMELNLYDCIVFFFCEWIPSFLIVKTNKQWNNFKIEELWNKQNVEYDLTNGPIIDEERMPILDKQKALEEKMKEFLDNFEEKKNYDKFS